VEGTPRIFKRRIGGEARVRIAVEGFLKALKAMADHCPIPDYLKRQLEEKARSIEESPWQTVARYVIEPDWDKSRILDVLRDVADHLGFDPEEYRPYVPE